MMGGESVKAIVLGEESSFIVTFVRSLISQAYQVP